MKNKTIRKRQIYKNINKNKTKYITGGALSDYFAEIKKGLNAKCISETDVNNVNYMKKQLSELNYKINKMENKNNNECSDTCMREIMRIKF
jgi:TolA-binding protein